MKQWEEETGGDGGLSAGYDGDARNAILDEEGVAAEVLFPDADVLGTGRLSASPFGSGLAAGSQSDPADAVAGAAPTTAGSPTSWPAIRTGGSASP